MIEIPALRTTFAVKKDSHLPSIQYPPCFFMPATLDRAQKRHNFLSVKNSPLIEMWMQKFLLSPLNRLRRINGLGYVTELMRKTFYAERVWETLFRQKRSEGETFLIGPGGLYISMEIETTWA